VLFPAASLTAAGLSLSRFGFGFLRASEAQEVSRKVIAETAPSDPDPPRRMHGTGKVKVEVVITAGGSGKSAIRIGGNPVFEKSAVDAVKQGRFEPAQTETKAAIVLEFEDR
jgi:TonB family protein